MMFASRIDWIIFMYTIGEYSYESTVMMLEATSLSESEAKQLLNKAKIVS